VNIMDWQASMNEVLCLPRKKRRMASIHEWGFMFAQEEKKKGVSQLGLTCQTHNTCHETIIT
jgi:hypothetical protein